VVRRYEGSKDSIQEALRRSTVRHSEFSRLREERTKETDKQQAPERVKRVVAAAGVVRRYGVSVSLLVCIVRLRGKEQKKQTSYKRLNESNESWMELVWSGATKRTYEKSRAMRPPFPRPLFLRALDQLYE